MHTQDTRAILRELEALRDQVSELQKALNGLLQRPDPPLSYAEAVPISPVVAHLPGNCRERLRAEGKAYPRSGCSSCGSIASSGCPHSGRLASGLGATDYSYHVGGGGFGGGGSGGINDGYNG